MWKDGFEAAAKKLELTATLVNLKSQVELKRMGTHEKSMANGGTKRNSRDKAMC